MKIKIDPLKLASDLIQIKSITPNADKAIDLIISTLEPIGFTCKKLTFGEGKERVENLYAKYGDNKGPNLCFAGHVDVVPPGDENEWSCNPFSGKIENDMLFGRGSVDMKSSIASFIASTSEFLNDKKNFNNFGSISFLITGDEEGKAINGTKKVVEWLESNNEKIDGCIVGEPTNPERLGEMIKVGRRGSYSGKLTVYGVQGHVGYPHLAKNPINLLLEMIEPLTKINLDDGTTEFEPSTIMITSIDVGNNSYNVIPNKVSLNFNIRFNTLHSKESITDMLKKHFEAFDVKFNFDHFCNAEPFYTNSDHLVSSMEKAINEVTKKSSIKSTTGGTSDARFIKNICPVIEFGLVGKLMHKIDEKVSTKDILDLTKIYYNFLNIFFKEHLID